MDPTRNPLRGSQNATKFIKLKGFFDRGVFPAGKKIGGAAGGPIFEFKDCTFWLPSIAVSYTHLRAHET